MSTPTRFLLCLFNTNALKMFESLVHHHVVQHLHFVCRLYECGICLQTRPERCTKTSVIDAKIESMYTRCNQVCEL